MSYKDDVRSIAKDIVSDSKDSEDWDQMIRERLDTNHWIIHLESNEEVLDNTDHEPNNRELEGMVSPDGGWREYRQVAAIVAMQRDVLQVCEEIKDEYWCWGCESELEDGVCPICDEEE